MAIALEYRKCPKITPQKTNQQHSRFSLMKPTGKLPLQLTLIKHYYGKYGQNLPRSDPGPWQHHPDLSKLPAADQQSAAP